ncbi:MAG: hypothetical protein K2J71_00750 [Oscillospiraceae bacterium]|nr:hypothetical protein [Oscillospiraceae bacterium]
MGRYTGSVCKECRQVFQAQDDVVVCPDCGTPYHRTCWDKNGTCTNVSLHQAIRMKQPGAQGGWFGYEQSYRKHNGGIICRNCNHVNLSDSEICAACGRDLREQEQQDNAGKSSAEINPEKRQVTMLMADGQKKTFDFTDPCCGMSPEEDMAGERLGDVANFVKTNTIYYIPLFKRFKETGRKISFNLPCILFPYFYFANRKMWFMTILSGLLWIFSSVPSLMLSMLRMFTDHSYLKLFEESGVSAAAIESITTFLRMNQPLLEQLETPFFFLGILIRILFCLFGNYLYYQFTLRSVRRIRKHTNSRKIKNMLLQTEGGTNILNVFGCFGLYLAFIMIVSYIIGRLFLI